MPVERCETAPRWCTRGMMSTYTYYHPDSMHSIRMYRVVGAQQFLTHFSSDRRHMRTPEGLWQAPPPPGPCIRGACGT